jgi:hypothetical protein
VAEQEVIKHADKIIDTIKSQKLSYWEKVGEFLREIVIIVFAITLSIWFHNWSEQRSEQKQVKTFLLGLKHDINLDIEQTEQVIKEFNKFGELYTYIAGFSLNKKPDQDSLTHAISQLNSNIYLRPNKNRFNGFLAAGKFNNIESDTLSAEILNYYQGVLLQVQSSEGGWGIAQNQLNEFILNNTNDPSNSERLWETLSTPKGKYLAKRLIPWPQIYERYHYLIEKGKTIVSLIDKEYQGENK